MADGERLQVDHHAAAAARAMRDELVAVHVDARAELLDQSFYSADSFSARLEEHVTDPGFELVTGRVGGLLVGYAYGSMFARQFAKAHHTATRHGHRGFVSMQNHYNLAYREDEREMIPLCRDLGVGVIPWSPLARGLLAGGRTRTGPAATARAASDDYARHLYTDTDLDTADTLRQVAHRLGQPPARVALSWLLSRPGIAAPSSERPTRRTSPTRPPPPTSPSTTTTSTCSKPATSHIPSEATTDRI